MHRSDVYLARRLKDKGNECERNPTPPRVFPDRVPACRAATKVRSGSPRLILLVDDGPKAKDIIYWAV